MKVVGGTEVDAPEDVRVSFAGLSIPCPLKYDGKGQDGRHRWRAFAPIVAAEVGSRDIMVTLAKAPPNGHDLEIEFSKGDPADVAPWYRYENRAMIIEGCGDCLWGVHHCESCAENVGHNDKFCQTCLADDRKDEPA